VRAESSGERTLEDAKRPQRRDGAAVDLYPRCRRIVLYRCVIVRQVGMQSAFEERREVWQSRDDLRRMPREWSAERFRMPRHLAHVRRLLGAGPVTARVTGRGGRAERCCGAQQRQGNRAASPHQRFPTGDGQRHGNRNCRVESAPLSHSARADAMSIGSRILPSNLQGIALSRLVGIALAGDAGTPRFQGLMRIRMLRRPSEKCIDGVRLDRFETGLEYEVGPSLGALFCAEGWAEPLEPLEAAPQIPIKPAKPGTIESVTDTARTGWFRGRFSKSVDPIATAHDSPPRKRARTSSSVKRRPKR
jgi:hypothetical protein